MEDKNRGLIIAIIIATVFISGSLIFFGLQIKDANNSGGGGVAGVQNMDDDAFDAKVEASLDRYIAKKQNEQVDARKKAQEEAKKLITNVAPIAANDHVYGNKDAEVTLVEYSDFKCPFCSKFHPTAKAIVDESNGKVNWVFRSLPLSFHEPDATNMANASECVANIGGNDAYWKYAELLYEKGGEDLAGLAKEAGVDSTKFTECFNAKKYQGKVDSDAKNGAECGITGTPGTIVINNKTGKKDLVNGALPKNGVQDIIDGVLK